MATPRPDRLHFTGNDEADALRGEVDDVHAAHETLTTAGIEIVGTLQRDSTWEWLHFRAPDGNLYELASRHAPQA